MAVYQLNRPDIETIIDYCNDLDAGEKLEVFEFGKDCDLVLHIYKDEEFDREKTGIFTTLLPSALPETANGSMIPGMSLYRRGIVPRACQNF